MKPILSFIFSFVSIAVCVGQAIIANPQDSQNEGGELQLLNSNSNYNKWHIDNYQGNLRFFHDGAVYFTMKPNGNTGIGTSNPTSLLDIRSSNNNRVRFNYNDTPSVSFLPNDGDSHFHISHTLSNRLTISQGSIVGVNSLITIVNSGAVGIGATTPDAKLAVKGNIQAEEVKIDLNVPGLKEGYDLKSLEEVQNYIKEHSHLPNIPSARDMEENGIQLGEMNMKLLEKIEELTLYVLMGEKKHMEKDEKIKALEKRLQILEPKIK